MVRKPATPTATLDEIVQSLDESAEASMSRSDHTAAARSANMRIDRQGRWYHDGRPIQRERLVRLFASVLQVDDEGQGWLVTPVERLSVDIEDAPFVATDVHRQDGRDGGVLVFTTNLGETVTVDRDHPIEVRSRSDRSDDYRPYVRLRDRLYVLILRSTYHQLAAFVDERDGVLGVESGGLFMPLERLPAS